MRVRKGQALVELAITLSIVLMLFSFMLDIFDQIHANIIAMNAVREGARWGARQKDPSDMLRWASWKTCDSLSTQGYLPDHFSCPPLEGVSVSTENAQIRGEDIHIVAGWVRDQGMVTSHVTGFQFPYGHPNQFSDIGNAVPLWVAVRLERSRLLGYFPAEGYQRYVVLQQNTVLADTRH